MAPRQITAAKKAMKVLLRIDLFFIEMIISNITNENKQLIDELLELVSSDQINALELSGILQFTNKNNIKKVREIIHNTDIPPHEKSKMIQK